MKALLWVAGLAAAVVGAALVARFRRRSEWAESWREREFARRVDRMRKGGP